MAHAWQVILPFKEQFKPRSWSLLKELADQRLGWRALCHCDARLDNFYFPEGQAEAGVLDFQMVKVQCMAYDVMCVVTIGPSLLIDSGARSTLGAVRARRWCQLTRAYTTDALQQVQLYGLPECGRLDARQHWQAAHDGPVF